MDKRQVYIRKAVITAMFGAIACVLQLLEFAVPIMPSFIKFDISEFPALLASFSVSPWSGAAVCFIKNFLNLPHSQSIGVGELCNFLLGLAFVLPAGIIYRRHRNRKAALLGSIIGAALMALISFPLNYFVTYPLYMRLYMPLDSIVAAYQAIFPYVDGLVACLLLFNLPFTLLKGIVNILLVFPVYKRISPLIHRYTRGRR